MELKGEGPRGMRTICPTSEPRFPYLLVLSSKARHRFWASLDLSSNTSCPSSVTLFSRMLLYSLQPSNVMPGSHHGIGHEGMSSK